MRISGWTKFILISALLIISGLPLVSTGILSNTRGSWYIQDAINSYATGWTGEPLIESYGSDSNFIIKREAEKPSKQFKISIDGFRAIQVVIKSTSVFWKVSTSFGSFNESSIFQGIDQSVTGSSGGRYFEFSRQEVVISEFHRLEGLTVTLDYGSLDFFGVKTADNSHAYAYDFLEPEHIGGVLDSLSSSYPDSSISVDNPVFLNRYFDSNLFEYGSGYSGRKVVHPTNLQGSSYFSKASFTLEAQNIYFEYDGSYELSFIASTATYLHRLNLTKNSEVTFRAEYQYSYLGRTYTDTLATESYEFYNFIELQTKLDVPRNTQGSLIFTIDVNALHYTPVQSTTFLALYLQQLTVQKKAGNGKVSTFDGSFTNAADTVFVQGDTQVLQDSVAFQNYADYAEYVSTGTADVLSILLEGYSDRNLELSAHAYILKERRYRFIGSGEFYPNHQLGRIDVIHPEHLEQDTILRIQLETPPGTGFELSGIAYSVLQKEFTDSHSAIITNELSEFTSLQKDGEHGYILQKIAGTEGENSKRNSQDERIEIGNFEEENTVWRIVQYPVDSNFSTYSRNLIVVPVIHAVSGFNGEYSAKLTDSSIPAFQLEDKVFSGQNVSSSLIYTGQRGKVKTGDILRFSLKTELYNSRYTISNTYNASKSLITSKQSAGQWSVEVLINDVSIVELDQVIDPSWTTYSFKLPSFRGTSITLEFQFTYNTILQTDGEASSISGSYFLDNVAFLDSTDDFTENVLGSYVFSSESLLNLPIENILRMNLKTTKIENRNIAIGVGYREKFSNTIPHTLAKFYPLITDAYTDVQARIDFTSLKHTVETNEWDALLPFGIQNSTHRYSFSYLPLLTKLYTNLARIYSSEGFPERSFIDASLQYATTPIVFL